MNIQFRAFGKMVAWVAVLSIIINLIFTAMGRAVSMPPETFGPYMYSTVATLTFVGIIAASIFYYSMRISIKDTAKVNKWFITLSVIVLIASFYPDVMLPYSPDTDDIGWT